MVTPGSQENADGDGADKRPRPKYQLHNLVYESEDFCIWLCDRLDVWWQTEKCFETKITQLQQRPEWGELMAKQTELEALPMGHLSEEARRGFRFQIGNAILLLFTEKYDHARRGMAAAEAFYRARTAEQARIWILSAGLMSMIVTTAVAGISGWLGKVVVLEPANLFEEVMLGAYCGSIGAVISLISRASVLGIDATAGRWPHYMESVCRSVTGIVAGSVLVCAVSAGIVVPGIIKAGPQMVMVLGFAAGFSERFLPNLIEKVELSMRGNTRIPGAGRGTGNGSSLEGLG